MRWPYTGRPFIRNGTIITLACALWFTGCAVSVEQDGPGPIEPVGPVGSVAGETGEPGSGVIVREERDAGDATRVVFNSEGQVLISIGAEASLTVEADDNLIARLESEIDEDILRIRTADGIDIAPSRPPRFLVTLPTLTEVELGGVGDIDVESIEGEILSITLSGVGDMTLSGVDVGLLLYDLTGVGTVSVGGTADDLRGSVSGQCSFLAVGLIAERAMLQASGGGYAVISVVSELEVTAIDTATVEYYGSPAVTQEVRDLGSVTGLGER